MGRDDQFPVRARAITYARLAFDALGLLLVFLPPWKGLISLSPYTVLVVYVLTLFNHAGVYFLIEWKWGRHVFFVSMLWDIVLMLFLTISTGGLVSPLMAGHMVYAVFFAVLFPHPLAILPPLLLLPITAQILQIIGQTEVGRDVVLLLWYSGLDLILVIAVVYLDLKERQWWTQAMSLARLKREMAILEERQQIAREMHDGVGAMLSTALFQAEFLTAMAKEEKTRKELEELQEKLRTAISELRQVVRVMREEFDLRERLEEAVATASDIWGFGVTFTFAISQEAVSPMARLALFRIIQEALTNAGKHAGARTVKVTVEVAPAPEWADGSGDGVLITVSDDGKGASDEEMDKEGHYGLVGMRERVSRLNGSIRFSTSPGEGFTVQAWIPMEEVSDVVADS